MKSGLVNVASLRQVRSDFHQLLNFCNTRTAVILRMRLFHGPVKLNQVIPFSMILRPMELCYNISQISHETIVRHSLL